VANVLTVVWFVVAWVVMQTAVMLVTGLLLPNVVERAQRRIVARPVGSFFRGALFWLVSAFLAVALLNSGKHGLVQFLGWIAPAPMFACSVIGGAAFARLLAERMQPQAGNTSRLAQFALAALATSLSGLLPLIGWVVFFPVVGCICTGAGLSAVRRREKAVRAVERTVPENYRVGPADASIAAGG
jgi:hypothetical protein